MYYNEFNPGTLVKLTEKYFRSVHRPPFRRRKRYVILNGSYLDPPLQTLQVKMMYLLKMMMEK